MSYLCTFAHTVKNIPTFQSTAPMSPLIWSLLSSSSFYTIKVNYTFFKQWNILYFVLVDRVLLYYLVSLVYLCKYQRYNAEIPDHSFSKNLPWQPAWDTETEWLIYFCSLLHFFRHNPISFQASIVSADYFKFVNSTEALVLNLFNAIIIPSFSSSSRVEL